MNIHKVQLLKDFQKYLESQKYDWLLLEKCNVGLFVKFILKDKKEIKQLFEEDLLLYKDYDWNLLFTESPDFILPILQKISDLGFNKKWLIKLETSAYSKKDLLVYLEKEIIRMVFAVHLK